MIRGVVFDLGGTLVDRYSLSPLLNLKKAFQNHAIRLPESLISRDMGMKKYDHITQLAYEPNFREQFEKVYGRKHSSFDLDHIYHDFCEIQSDYLKHKLDILPETKDALLNLRDRGIKIGITTGFNKVHMDLCLDLLETHGISPDSAVSSTCLDVVSRPEPQMIQENMRRMDITNPKQILKVDDTCVGILEGHNADCITVGVARWSINMGIHSLKDKHRFDRQVSEGELDYEEHINTFKYQLYQSRQTLHTAKPCYVINTLSDLTNCLF